MRVAWPDLTVFQVPMVVAGVSVLAIIVGLAQLVAPIIGPAMIIGVVTSPLVLVVPLDLQVIGVLVLLVCSRLLLLVGAPSLITYAHFGLLLLMLAGLMLRQVILRVPPAPIPARIYRLMAILAIVICTSAAINGWYAFRPILSWLTWIEPFVLFAVVYSLSAPARKRIRLVLVGLAVLQIPFALSQFAQHGGGDDVKGTLIAQGAGHHILGAIGIIGGLILILDRPSHSALQLWRVGLLGMLFSLGLLSDAKQVYGALAIAALPFVLPMARTRPTMVITGALLIVGLAFVGPLLDPSFATTFNRKDVERNLTNKFSYVPYIVNHLGPVSTVIGDGPGIGASRIAQLTLPAYGHVPTFLVGSAPAPLADHLQQADMKRLKGRTGSSTDSPLNSVISLFTDLGIVGCVVYFALSTAVWRALANYPPFARTIGQTLLLMALILGLVFTWLEEPVYTVYLATTLATLAPSAAVAVNARRLTPYRLPAAHQVAHAHPYHS